MGSSGEAGYCLVVGVVAAAAVIASARDWVDATAVSCASGRADVVVISRADDLIAGVAAVGWEHIQ